jgi:tetratricopeptide (TPR) repeat protein
VLEQAAQGLPDDVAVAYDWAFTDTLLALGRPEQALTRALARERALPDNYNPPQYAARAYQALGRYAEGLAAIDRALGLAYGPRKIGFLTLKADLLQGAGRSAEALDTVRAQLAAYRALPAGQRQPAAEARVERRLRDWK